jgi:hypothetical protein
MINETVFLGGCPVIRPEGIYLDGHRVIRLGMGGVGVGAVERANPLPPGKYWVDVFTPQEAAFQDWLHRNKANVIVTTTESFDPTMDGSPGRVWRLFEVGTPVTWEGPGLPTIADPGVKSSEDTAQRPSPEKDPLDKLSDYGTDVAKTAKAVLWVVGGVVAVVVGGVLIVRYLPRPAPAPSPGFAPTPYRGS